MNFLQKLTTITTVTTIATLTSATAQAATLSASNFGNEGFSFAQETTLYFEYLEGHGMARSDLGVYTKDANGNYVLEANVVEEEGAGYDRSSNDHTNDWLGSAGTTVTAPRTGFTFLAGETYFFGVTGEVLSNETPGAKNWLTPDHSLVGPLTTVYSDTRIETMDGGITALAPNYTPGGGVGDYVFKAIDAPSYTFTSIGPTKIKSLGGVGIPTTTLDIEEGAVLLAWEDSLLGSDADFQDLIVKAYIDDDGDFQPDTDSVAVPEPSTAGALLGVGVLGLFNLRRRNSRKNG